MPQILQARFHIVLEDLEKEEEPEIKGPISVRSWKKQGNFRKTSPSASFSMLTPLTLDNKKLWKIHKEMETLDHLIYLPRNIYTGQEVTESDMGQGTGSKLGKEYIKVVYCHPAYLTCMQSTS